MLTTGPDGGPEIREHPQAKESQFGLPHFWEKKGPGEAVMESKGAARGESLA